MLNILNIYILGLCLKIVHCCDCDLDEMIKDTAGMDSILVMKKRQMQDGDEDDFVEKMSDPENTVETTTTCNELINSKETMNLNNVTTESILMKVLINNKKAREETKQHNTSMNDKCLFFKNMPRINFDKMVDVWKISFYRTSQKLTCFKLLIKKTTVEEREECQQTYGDLNGTIDWRNCRFEMASNMLQSGSTVQRHFLQGSKEDRGVFKNIIVTRDETADIVTVTEQSPDQWLVINNLLLMRDCENGDIVVFTRIPMEPSLGDMEHALAVFGEDAGTGSWSLACETLRNPKYRTLS